MSIEDFKETIILKICTACSREFAGAEGVCPHDGQKLITLPQAQDLYLNQEIADKYKVTAILGIGGMGVVYRARHDLMERDVAIKMLKAQYVSDKLSVKRFTREAIAVGRLRHPNVISTYDHGFTAHGQPYLVMDILQGQSLAQLIKTEKQIPTKRAIHIIKQACEALDHAHQKGVIHRDLKPGNIMLVHEQEDPDFVKVVDFGVAQLMVPNGEDQQHLTQAGEVCGSPIYMSPEQCLGKPLDRRADIYSLGVVLYETLTGKLPLMGNSMIETMSKHIHEAPPPMNSVRPDIYISPRLEQTVLKALAKDPNMRQQSMALLKQELIASEPNSSTNLSLRNLAPQEALIEREEKNGSQKTWLAPTVIAAVVAVVVLGGILMFAMNKPKPSTTITPTANPTPVQTITAPPVISNPPAVKPLTTEIKNTPVPTKQANATKAIKTSRAPRITKAYPATEEQPARRADPFATLGSHRSYKTKR